MLARKGARTHRRAGLTYLAALAVACLSGTALVITRWPRFPHLLVLAVVAIVLAGGGYAARRRPSPVPHLLGMGTSYVAMLTAFYVDNGPRLPLWRLLPPGAFWLLPSLVALPLLVGAVRRYGRPTGPAAARRANHAEDARPPEAAVAQYRHGEDQCGSLDGRSCRF